LAANLRSPSTSLRRCEIRLGSYLASSLASALLALISFLITLLLAKRFNSASASIEDLAEPTAS